jgi:hypothetical protein
VARGGRHGQKSACSKRHCGTVARAFSSIAADPSTPTISARGKRCRKIAVTLPRPQPKSTTRAGPSRGTCASRSSEVGLAHSEIFGDVRPASTMVQVSALIRPEMRVEIEAYAVIDES